MLGACAGDIIGSRFEYNNIKNKKFALFSENSHFTDDTVMTLAVAKGIMDSGFHYWNLKRKTVAAMKKIGLEYPNCGYGTYFNCWLYEKKPKPYNSYGNGAAMRISAVGFAAKNLDEVKKMSAIITGVSHNHPEAIKGAEATASCVWMAKNGYSMDSMKKYVQAKYYPLDFTLDSIRYSYSYHLECQETVPQALEAFFESESFEDAIRNAISIGGDSDTIAAIAGGVAEAYYGVPEIIEEKVYDILDDSLKVILWDFEKKYVRKSYL